mmetsp:Transcript_731/g.2464  ORF Transcript_731/g.2464 Transcript_731/m.2464 type:complete len:150 (+) Transcript_731:2554-3003(+)
MFVGLDDDGVVDTRYEDKSAEDLMKHVLGIVLHKVPDEIGEIGRGIYKYKVVDGVFVLKDDLSDFVKQNKQAIINSYRSTRDELLTQTDWTQTEDCPLDIHMKEKYRAYRKYLRDFPQTHDPEVDENGEVVGNFNLPETVNDFVLQLSF